MNIRLRSVYRNYSDKFARATTAAFVADTWSFSVSMLSMLLIAGWSKAEPSIAEIIVGGAVSLGVFFVTDHYFDK